MKILAENLNEYILDRDNTINPINEGLIEDYLKNTDKQVRKNLIKLMIGGMLAIPSGAILNGIMSDDTVDNKVTELVNNVDMQPEELVKQLNILANYIPTAMEDETSFLKDVRKGAKKVKNHDGVKRKAPAHFPSLQELSSYNINDRDLKANKVEISMNKMGVPGYLRYFKWATTRGHNAPNDGYINLNDIRMSNRGVHNLMKEEAYRNFGYRAESSGNIVTVGFGTAFNPSDYAKLGLHTPVKMGEIVPERKLFIYFYGKLQEFEIAVAKVIREGVAKNPNMRYMPQSAVDALISFSYSTGAGGFKDSKLGKALSNGNIKEAAYWVKNGKKSETGHTHRRNREYEMFTNNFNGTDWGKPKDKELSTALDASYKTYTTKIGDDLKNKKVEAKKPVNKSTVTKKVVPKKTVNKTSATKKVEAKKTPNKGKSSVKNNTKKVSKKINNTKKGVKK